MPRLNNILFFCLSLVAAFGRHVDAARLGDEAPIPDDPFLILPPGTRPDAKETWRPRDLGEKVFTLRHIYHHGTHRFPDLHRYQDISKDAPLYIDDVDGLTKLPTENKLRAKALSTRMERMSDRSRQSIDGLLEYAGDYGHAMTLPSSAWTVDEISGPNHTDKSTVITFAKIANNAYTEEAFSGGWQDVKGGFNYTDDFGWKDDGLRGHIFADETNKTIVIGLKGTSMAVFDGADTTTHDKVNDNLFGSCCCAQGGHYTWKKVCDCKSDDGYTCNATCVRKALNKKSHYYWAAKDLYHNVTERYPDADVWLSGHSLGGVVSTLIGLTFGSPVMTFEAYPDALAASRLGLPTPPGYHAGMHQSRLDTGIHHFGHTADPIFTSSCGTAGSLCTIAGYAFESSCHTGEKCTYDTVSDFGWRSSVVNHKIITMITEVLEKYDTVANCSATPNCQDCYIWKFFESNGTETSTSATSTATSRTRTRTETCKTPGWWGCLDETTTTVNTTTTSSSASPSTTCETPGWFGCKDSTTTTIASSTAPSSSASPAPTMTTTTSVPTASSSCADPGWFGCNDPTSTVPATSSSVQSTSPSPTSSHTCTSKAWFGFVCLDPSPTDSSSTPSPTNLPTARRKCVSRHWYGTCREWVSGPAAFKQDL